MRPSRISCQPKRRSRTAGRREPSPTPATPGPNLRPGIPDSAAGLTRPEVNLVAGDGTRQARLTTNPGPTCCRTGKCSGGRDEAAYVAALLLRAAAAVGRADRLSATPIVRPGALHGPAASAALAATRARLQSPRCPAARRSKPLPRPSEAVGKGPVAPLDVAMAPAVRAARGRPRAAVSGGDGGEAVVVEFEEVVGCGDEPPFGPARRSPAALEASD